MARGWHGRARTTMLAPNGNGFSWPETEGLPRRPVHRWQPPVGCAAAVGRDSKPPPRLDQGRNTSRSRMPSTTTGDRSVWAMTSSGPMDPPMRSRASMTWAASACRSSWCRGRRRPIVHGLPTWVLPNQGRGRAWEAELYQLATRLRRDRAHTVDQ